MGNRIPDSNERTNNVNKTIQICNLNIELNLTIDVDYSLEYVRRTYIVLP